MHMNLRVKLHLCLSTVTQKGGADKEYKLSVPGLLVHVLSRQPGKVFKFVTTQVQ
jgi:hypothetical protein